MQKPTLHLIGMFHTIPNHDYDHCAFTGKVLRFSKMMRKFGYEIIEYSNGNSISEANLHVQILTKEEVIAFVGEPTSLLALHGRIDTPIYAEFHKRLKEEIIKYVKPNDIIIHPYSYSHEELVKLIPQCFHTELAIGYEGRDFGAFRIYESYSWMHYLLGKYGKWGNRYDFVVNNYLDKDEWEPNYEPGNYYLFVGRVIDSKGMSIVMELAKRLDKPMVIAGMGDIDKFKGPNMNFIGYVHGVKEKNDLFKNAIALIAPTDYIEPFGTVVIEAMMSGTPVIASDFGAFVETVEQGKTGFRCRTLGDFLAALKEVTKLDRKYIADSARNRWSYEVIGAQYDKIFKQIYDLKDKGWYTEKSYIIGKLDESN